MFESVLVLGLLGCNCFLYCWLCGYVICELATRFSILHADYSARRIDFLFECRVQKYYYSAEKRQKMPKIAPHNSQKISILLFLLTQNIDDLEILHC